MSDSNDTIDKMSEQFQSLSEMKAYSQAQFRTIIEQSKKITKLEEEVRSLKKDLINSTPKEGQELVASDLLKGTDQEIICQIQINRYKEVSLERELSLEESKKLEIYTKILQAGKDRKAKGEASAPSDPLDLKDLMSVFEEGNG